MQKKLYRDEQHKVIGGVCAGLADYFNTEASIIRFIFLLALIFKGGGFLIYIVLWIVLPRKSYEFTTPGVDYTTPPHNEFGQVFNKQARRPSNAGLIGGLVLVLLGVFLLLDEFNFIPNVDMEHLWPIIPITIGVVFIITSGKKTISAPKPPIE
ncbi:PspC domain-containing protein [Mucilaginibacter sp. Bleaf8]|uniref:PspC domain-containing protein n=1 Tax=Mucilaginibacter sp. Bleaf8 TaxID=2834430 RepID=UPI001BCB83E8|nr:PspC domain-containing protein [Mucilaginibacter sp. Bleaf8]MBS7564175.1 PspC domain-containing protein [Mucilaginibacter sp. Bleaf8]